MPGVSFGAQICLVGLTIRLDFEQLFQYDKNVGQEQAETSFLFPRPE
jgi:hypothetical protein